MPVLEPPGIPIRHSGEAPRARETPDSIARRATEAKPRQAQREEIGGDWLARDQFIRNRAATEPVRDHYPSPPTPPPSGVFGGHSGAFGAWDPIPLTRSSTGPQFNSYRLIDEDAGLAGCAVLDLPRLRPGFLRLQIPVGHCLELSDKLFIPQHITSLR